MKKINNIIILVTVFLLSLNFAFACYSPTGGDENTYFDENSGTDLILCSGDYYFNDMGSPDGIFHMQGNNYEFDCNNSNLFGNQSGTRAGVMFRFTGTNVTLKNCNINQFITGINIDGSNDNKLENIDFKSNQDNDIYISGNNNEITGITSIGDGNGDASIKIENSQNNILNDIKLFQNNYGIWLKNSPSNILENITINKTSSLGIQIESGDNNNFSNIIFENTMSNGIQVGSSYNIFDNMQINNTNFMAGISITWNGNNNTIKNSQISYASNGIDVGGEYNSIDNLSGSNSFYLVNFMYNNNLLINSNLSNCLNSGIKFDSMAEGNLIYNNYFSNNTGSQVDFNTNTNNQFNTTLQSQTNIIGGNSIGGNYYGDYIGIDTTGNGIGNISYDLGDGVFDYLPLTNTQSIPVSSRELNISTNLDIITEGNQIEFQINFSDFNNPTNITINFDDTNITTFDTITSPFYINHTFLDNGNYSINISVYDDSETMGELKLIEVLNTIPHTISWNVQSNQDSTFSFQPLFSDNGTLDTHNVFVYWGDGTNSTLITDSSNLIYHNYSTDGTYTINFTIIDNNNLASNFQDFDVTLNDDIFNISILGNQTIILGENTTIRLFMNYILSQNVSINWGDNQTTNDTNEANLNEYQHNYSTFGNHTINATLRGHRSGTVVPGEEPSYYSTLLINVIGYGDNIINNNESCDTNNFASKTCSTYGHNQGSLTCNQGIINSSACSTKSSGGGGGSSKKKEEDTLTEDIINNETITTVPKINKTEPTNSTLEDYLTESSNQTNYVALNGTLPKKNNTDDELTQDTQDEYLSLINITLPPKKNESELFNFKPYLDTIFNFFEVSFDKEEYDFKPRLSFIFTQYSNEINWNTELIELKEKETDVGIIGGVIDWFGDLFVIEQDLNLTAINNTNNFTFKPFLEKTFKVEKPESETVDENFTFKPFLEKAFKVEKPESDINNENFTFKPFLEKAFKVKKSELEITTENFTFKPFLEKAFKVEETKEEKNEVFTYKPFLEKVFQKEVELN